MFIASSFKFVFSYNILRTLILNYRILSFSLIEGPVQSKDSMREPRFQPAFQQEPVHHRMPGDQDHGRSQADYIQEPQPRPVRESRFDRDREVKRGAEGDFRLKEGRDIREDRDRRDYMQREREPRERDQKDRDRDQRDREVRERDREPRGRDLRDREQRDREQRDREPRDREQRDREARDRDHREREREHRSRGGREREDERERHKDRERHREKEDQKESEKEVEEDNKGLSSEERKQLGFPDFKKGRISRKFNFCLTSSRR